MLTSAQLKQIFPNATMANIQKFLPFINKHLSALGSTDKKTVAAFLAQIGHESGELQYVLENLNYSAEGLRKTFSKYFPTTALAQSYARKPQAIANRVYANRMGNGNEASGDGWRFRGKGLIQLTGRTNVTLFAKWRNIPVNDASVLLETAEGAVLGAIWFWTANNLNRFVVANDFTGLTRAINGGTNGLAHRQQLYANALKTL